VHLVTQRYTDGSLVFLNIKIILRRSKKAGCRVAPGPIINSMTI
jgi:hypothetical protein